MSTRVLQAARSAVLAVALAALVGTTSGQVKPSVKALTLTPMDYIEIRQLVKPAFHCGPSTRAASLVRLPLRVELAQRSVSRACGIGPMREANWCWSNSTESLCIGSPR